MSAETPQIGSSVNPDVYVPTVLRGHRHVAPGSCSLRVDATKLPDEGRNILIMAANGQKLPNCDPLLYTKENAANWAAVAETSHDNSDEIEPITRAAISHAVWLHPPEVLGLWTIGAATTFNVKERIIIEEHVREDRGHQFKFWAYSDVNQESLDQSVKDGEKLAKELGLKGITHIPLLGDVFDPEVRKRNKLVLKEQGVKVLTTCFGYTLQNLQKRVSGYKEATAELTETLSSLHKTMPRGSTLFSTFAHESDKEKARAPYVTEEGERFVREGARQYLGDQISDRLEYSPRFVGSTTVLERPLRLTEEIIVDFGKEETAILHKGTDVWMGISAKQRPNYVSDAFDAARFIQVLPKPFFNSGNTVTCQVACKNVI